MKILLIQPSRLNDDGTVYHNTFRWLIGMTLPYLAGLCGSEHDIRLIDDCFQEVPYNEHWDLVGITFMSHQTPRAFQIADEFRDRGVTVVMGGFHVSLGDTECLEHSDAIIIGEAEYTWPQLIKDHEKGELKKIYRSDKLHNLENLPIPRYDLLNLKKYRIKSIPVQTTRGCPWDCNYCEVTKVYGGKYRFRPLEEVVEEIKVAKTLTGRFPLYFVDDNFAVNKTRASQLMEELIRQKVSWTGLCTMHMADDEEFLKLMKRSGCKHLNLGMETINPDSLSSIDKRQNKIGEYKRQIHALRKSGIDFSINVMFGLDGDTAEIFNTTRDFLIDNKVPTAYMFILAPRIGTKIRDQLLAEDRIFNNDWTKYCGYEAVHYPKNMTVEELEDAFWKIHQDFYSLPSIFKRRLYSLQSWTANLFFAWGVRKRRHPLTFY